MMSFSTDNVYVVTGAASGMGLSTVELLLQKGAKLGICDINEAALTAHYSKLPENFQARVLYQSVDVTNQKTISAFLHSVKNHFGKLDGIVNCAGTGGHKLGEQLIWDTDQPEYDFIMNLNVKALYHILHTALQPGFLSEPGSIVHVTSMYAERGFQNGAIFTASKHAANGMVKSAALEVAHRGIRINAVMPGPIDTPMLRAGRTNVPAPKVPMGRLGLPEEVASMAAFLLGQEASYITGSQFAVDGGANAAGRHE